MRFELLCAGILSIGLAAGQTRDLDARRQNLGLVGNRFQPLTWGQMSPEQQRMIDHLLAGDRGGLGGPFNVLLRSPEMGDLAQQFGAAMRFHAELPKPALETVILITARFWMAQFEWSAHKRAALQAGVDPAVVDAIADGRRPTAMAPDIEAAYNFVAELLKSKQVSDRAFQAARDRFGEKGVVDIIGLSGWYSMVSMALNVDRYPLAKGAQPELKPLAEPIP